MKAYIDYLTGLPNIFYLEKEYHNYLKDRKKGFLLLIDLKELKYINDNFGHAMGDKSIVLFTTYLSQFFESSLVIRRSGDEFVVVTAMDEEEIILTLKKIVEAIQKEREKGSIPLAFVFNCGSNLCEDDLKETLSKADLAMYYAKRNNQLYKSYQPRFLEKIKRRDQFIKRVDKLLNDKTIAYALQNVSDVNGKRCNIGQIYSRDQEGASIFSEDKFEILKTNRYLKRIDILNLEKLITEILPKLDNENKYIINIYHETLFLKENQFLNVLQRLKKKGNYSFQKIILNLNISKYNKEISKLINLIIRLKEKGFLLSLDCINSDEPDVILPIISLLSVDYVNISRKSLIKAINEKRYSQVLQTMIKLLLKLDIIPLFINVENKDEVDYIKQLSDKCLIRGYVYENEEIIKE